MELVGAMDLYPHTNGNCGELVASYKYILKMDGKVVYEGQDPEARYRELKKRYPDARISIIWVSLDDDILIVPVSS